MVAFRRGGFGAECLCGSFYHPQFVKRNRGRNFRQFFIRDSTCLTRGPARSRSFVPSRRPSTLPCFAACEPFGANRHPSQSFRFRLGPPIEGRATFYPARPVKTATTMLFARCAGWNRTKRSPIYSGSRRGDQGTARVSVPAGRVGGLATAGLGAACTLACRGNSSRFGVPAGWFWASLVYAVCRGWRTGLRRRGLASGRGCR